MLRVQTQHARAGMVLALPVLNPRRAKAAGGGVTGPSAGGTLLKLGYTLTEEDPPRLARLGISEFWVRYPSLAFLDKTIDPELLRRQGTMVKQIRGVFESLQQKTNAALPYDQYVGAITDLVESLLSHPQAAVFLGGLMASDGEIDPAHPHTLAGELMRHASAVTYLSLLMGLRLQTYLVRQRPHAGPFRAKQVDGLGLGAMLHDVGLTQLPPPVLERYLVTGDASDPEYQEHPRLGYGMVHGQIEPTAAAVVYHHHQAMDGSGFAGEQAPVLAGQRIHVFARIVAVADRMDRLMNPLGPGVRRPRPTIAALRELSEPAQSAKLDPEVLAMLYQVAPAFPPGSVVRLSDGRHAVVTQPSAQAPCCPTVMPCPDPAQMGGDDLPLGEAIDLAQCEDDLSVVSCDGQEVDV